MFWSRPNKIGRNEICTCGSGVKFKNCCYLLPKNQRTHAALLLQEKNVELIAIAAEIFGLNGKQNWLELSSTMTNDQVSTFYSEYARLWPINNTDVFASLPLPTKKLRGLYMGDLRPQKILTNILRYSLYTDEIIVVNPLHHPHSMRPEYSPIQSPTRHKQDTLEVLYFLVALSPWIQKGIVHLVPNPLDFDPQLRRSIWTLAKQRTTEQGFQLSPEEEAEIEIEAKELDMRIVSRLTSEQQIIEFSKRNPNATGEEIKHKIKLLEKERNKHPLWLNQPLPEGGELIVKRMGANLEAGLMLGQATGSYLYTNRHYQWKEILSAQQSSAESEIWSPLTHSFQQLDFKFLDKVDPMFVYHIQEEGRLSNLRAYLRRLWGGLNANTTEAQVREFSDELHEEHAKTLEEWKEIDRKLRDEIFSKDGLASAFFGVAAGAATNILNGNLDWKLPLAGFAMPAVNALLNSKSSRRKFRNTVPLSVFIDLDNKGKMIER